MSSTPPLYNPVLFPIGSALHRHHLAHLLPSHLAARHVVKCNVSSAQVEALSQGEGTQVHSGPKAEPRHLLPRPGHPRRSPKLSSVLHNLRVHSSSSATASSSHIPWHRHTCSKPRRRWKVRGTPAENVTWLYLCFPG